MIPAVAGGVVTVRQEDLHHRVGDRNGGGTETLSLIGSGNAGRISTEIWRYLSELIYAQPGAPRKHATETVSTYLMCCLECSTQTTCPCPHHGYVTPSSDDS